MCKHAQHIQTTGSKVDQDPTGHLSPWGKFDKETRDAHHLAHHCADVAAVFLCLLDHPLFGRAASTAAGRPLTDICKARLAAIAFLHDIGKIAPAFQAKGWLQGAWKHPFRSHVEAAVQWMQEAGDRMESALDGLLPEMLEWCAGDAQKLAEWLLISFSHHGRPIENGSACSDCFRPCDKYDWRQAERIMAEALRHWLPTAFEEGPPLPNNEPFKHFIAGLLALADWVGSDRRAFPFVRAFDANYWTRARQQAHERVRSIGLCALNRRLRNLGFDAILPGVTPNAMQCAIADAPVDERLLILESETGSGKTEAALWRYARLREAGEVEGLYFALPTRAAASQLFHRVNHALRNMFSEPPEAVLAIPGMVAAGDATGQLLPDWNVLWDDNAGAGKHPARWAAEHATRYLAAEVAVGTVDQAMLATLCIRHAHMRGSALARSLLVIDEVHASDAYMRYIQTTLLRQHLALGGHALLMSATLGAVARVQWLETALPELLQAADTPYPALWMKGSPQPVAPQVHANSNHANNGEKCVHLQEHKGWDGKAVAALAIEAARKGARVLVIRNTVQEAVNAWQAVVESAPDLLLQVDGGPALHHSRFAAEDRQLLDRAVEGALGKAAPRNEGLIVIGTQTLEQSLDIDADYLITDLCPIDVLLQRIGRLHRHANPRPDGFAQPQTLVLTPAAGLEPLLRRGENGLGNYGRDGSLSGVYVDVPALAATLEQIRQQPEWRIPAMNRQLVEAATHPEALDMLARERSPDWQEYRQHTTGKELAERGLARRVILDRTKPFFQRYPDEEKIKTRIGEEGVVLSLPDKPLSPFGQRITRLALPPQWSHGLTEEEELACEMENKELHLTLGGRTFIYTRKGVDKY